MSRETNAVLCGHIVSLMIVATWLVAAALGKPAGAGLFLIFLSYASAYAAAWFTHELSRKVLVVTSIAATVLSGLAAANSLNPI